MFLKIHEAKQRNLFVRSYGVKSTPDCNKHKPPPSQLTLTQPVIARQSAFGGRRHLPKLYYIHTFVILGILVRNVCYK